MNKVVYHFTSALQLPWIVESGELRPIQTSDAGIGYSALLWATAGRDRGYRTCLAARSGERKDLVRLTLPAEGFLTWDETARQQGWTPGRVLLLEWDDQERHGEYSHHLWHCRAEPLPLANVLKAELWISAERWRPIKLDPGLLVRTRDPKRLGYRLGRRTVFSTNYLARDYLSRLGDGEPCPPESHEDKLADAAFIARWKAEGDDTDYWSE